MLKLLRTLFLIALTTAHFLWSHGASLIIFSYDRPLQLWALLESIDYYITGLSDIQVIYRVSDDRFEKAYQEIIEQFNTVEFIAQGLCPREDFKPLTLRALQEDQTEYVVFAVDDIVVKDYININECIEVMERFNAYGFYLKLGLHVTECYTMNRYQGVPPGHTIEDSLFVWQFNRGKWDWNYPNTVDMTIYRKAEIMPLFEHLSYQSPNYLEGHWAGQAHRVKSRLGVCYQESKVVNLPLNRVQNDNSNRHMGFLSPQEMLEVFDRGLKIDIHTLHRIHNKAVHMEYVPTFVER